MAENPTTHFRDYTWLSIVLDNDKEHHEPEDVYVFGNGRKFKSSDKTDSGVYE